MQQNTNSHFPSMVESSECNQGPQGRVAIITGGACGLGFEIAQTLFLHQYRVILVNANDKASSKAISHIRKKAGLKATSTTQIEHRHCDMTDLVQIQAVFSTLCENLSRLDLCIFGSGIDRCHFEMDVHCIDAYFGMTWLGHFYASNLLWPLLRKTSKEVGVQAPRIVFEAPEMQKPAGSSSVVEKSSSDDGGAELTAENKTYEKRVCEEIFRRSRTSLVLGVRYGLAERIIKRHGDNIYALAVQPVTATEIDGALRRDSHSSSSEINLCQRMLDTLASATEIPIRSTSRSVIYAATSPDVETDYLNGAYLVDLGVTGQEKDLASDPSLGPGFWDISERAIKAVVGKDAMTAWDACLETKR